MRVKQYFDQEFVQFSRYDNVRSIPSLRDGFKPAQRKCIYGTQQRGENAGEVQIERLAASIAADTKYHHGTGSLEATLVGLAQTFAGSNNVNLFEPLGQFGSRLSPSAASARYIFTKFSANFRKLFKKEDDIILKHMIEDGDEIEPEYYIPLLPLVLINGSRGVGTGYASNILSYNPEDLKTHAIAIVNGKKASSQLLPWFRGFTGKVGKVERQVIIEGKLEIVNTTTIKVSELPIGMYLDDFKKVLYDLEDEGLIKGFEDMSTETAFEFVINAPRTTTSLSNDVLMKKFKLISRETENFTLWDTNNKIREYGTPEEILEEFVNWRLERYEDRRLKLLDLEIEQLEWLNEKLRFVMFYLKHTKDFAGQPKLELLSLLEKNKFKEVDRLLRLPIYTLTHDEIEKLRKEIGDSEEKILMLNSTTAKKLYLTELKELDL